MPKRRLLALVILLAVPLAALSEGPGPDRATSRRALDKYRADPNRFARLRQELDAFLDLPPERQQQLRKLDQDIHDEASARQAHLFQVMERYGDWLDRLKEEDRKAVLEAKDKTARLQRVRELRERDWLRRQPQKVQKDLEILKKFPPRLRQAITVTQLAGANPLAGASGLVAGQVDVRGEAVQRLRNEERQRRLEWQIAARHWDDLTNPKKALPVKASDDFFLFTGSKEKHDVKLFVEEYLKPMLSPDERERLAAAENRWPQFPYTLVELADKHPLALPHEHGPRTLKELPKEIQTALTKPGPKGGGPLVFAKQLKAAEGSWPKYGSVVAKIIADRKLATRYEFLPTNINDLNEDMRDFVQLRLLKVLNEAETKSLFALERDKLWPEFPLRIQELADKYHLTPPWQTLPGKRDKWNGYRLKIPVSLEGLPALPPHKLRAFALTELDDRARAALNLSPTDQQKSFQILTEEYFKRRPDELNQLRQKDAQHQKKGGESIQKGQRPGNPGKRGD